MNRVVIIDSGIDPIYYNDPNFKIIAGINFSGNGGKEDICDNIGHGTAIASIIYSINKSCEFVIIKIYGEKLEQEEGILVKALNYIINSNIKKSIIHMSVGVNYYNAEIEKVCNNIYANHNVIISAFDNLGCISYPAAFECVIGVEASNRCIKRSEFIITQNEIVDVYAKGGFHRTIGVKGGNFIKQGNSMSAAYVSGYLSNSNLANYTKEEAIEKIHNSSTYIHREMQNENNYFDCRFMLTEKERAKIVNAGIFPYDKETSVVVRYADMLGFNISEIYTSRYMGNYKTRVYSNKSYMIKNIEKIDENKIDTLIVGHLNKLEIVLPDIKKNLLELCYKKKINVFSLDSDLLNTYINKFENEKLFLKCPTIIGQCKGKKGKMYKLRTPVLGVFGTSSKQGKFSLQLELKRCFEKNDYSVGFLSTEPAGVLFNADSTISYGYNGIRDMSDYEFIDLINEQLHSIDLKKKDIIISGAQSRTVPEDNNHLGHMAIKQVEFLMGLQPDAVILCVNYNDSADYIKRTINIIENLTTAKVVSIVIFPFGYKNGWKKQNDIFERVPNELLLYVQKCVENKMNIKTFIMDKDIKRIYDTVIDYF